MAVFRRTGRVLLAAVVMTSGAVVCAATPSTASATSTATMNCTKWGYGKSTGGAKCTEQPFRVRVWCTWGGSGISANYAWFDNTATCSRGTIHWDDPEAIEIIL